MEVKKMIVKADFNKVWSESTTEDILNQFYYEHIDLRYMVEIFKKLKKIYLIILMNGKIVMMNG